MRLTKEALSVAIVVRRVGRGAAPFGWAVHRVDTDTLIHASPDRFRSLDEAYRAGQAQLAAFIPQRTRPPGVTEYREWQASRLGFDDDEVRPAGDRLAA